MRYDFFGNEITSGWRGTNCKLLYLESNELTDEYLAYRIDCMPEVKGREHYYVKSFIVPHLMKDAGIDTVFHIGFAHGRYLWSYKYFYYKAVMGCELPHEEGGGIPAGELFVEETKKKHEYILFKDFLELTDEDIEKTKEFDLSNACLVTEASLMCFVDRTQDYITKFAQMADEEFYEKRRILVNRIEKFHDVGFNNFVFIEQDDELFRTLNLNGLQYSCTKMGPNFIDEFSMNYIVNKYIVAHIWSANNNLHRNIQILTK